MVSPVRKAVVRVRVRVTPPAVVHKVDVAESLVQLLPGVRIAGQPSHLALRVLVVEVGEVGEVVVEQLARQLPSGS